MAVKILMILVAVAVSAQGAVIPAPLAVAPYATSYAAHVTHHSVAAPVARLLAAPAAPLVAAPATPLLAAPAAPLVAAHAAPLVAAPAAPLVAAPAARFVAAPVPAPIVAGPVSVGAILPGAATIL